MFYRTFAEETVVRSTSELATIFGTDSIHLKNGTQLTLVGGVEIAPGVIFDGICALDDGCTVATGSMIENATFGKCNTIRAHSVISDFKAGNGNLLGPFCFLRNNCVAGDEVILGAHVEATRSVFADGVKISHRAFIGDADIGARTIVGAGSVFCNYVEGAGRQKTTIGADVTIGSGTMLIAPLVIGEKSLIGAGSVVTRDLPAGTRFVQKRDQLRLTMRTALNASA